MNAEIEKRIGGNVRKLRENANLTQEMLSARLQTMGCDITRSALAKIEVGQRHLYPDEIILIKDILKVSYDDIFDITKNRFDFYVKSVLNFKNIFVRNL